MGGGVRVHGCVCAVGHERVWGVLRGGTSARVCASARPPACPVHPPTLHHPPPFPAPRSGRAVVLPAFEPLEEDEGAKGVALKAVRSSSKGYVAQKYK